MGTVVVELSRDSLASPWGFRLEGGAELRAPLRVGRVEPLSAADGLLRQGDVLRAVNRDSVDGASLHTASALLMSAGGTMTLTISRGGPAPSGPTAAAAALPSSSRPPGLPQKDPNEKPPVPTNSQLAGLMNSTKGKNMITPTNQIYRTMPTFFRGMRNRPQDPLAYLPTAADVRRSGSLVRSAPQAPAASAQMDRELVASVLGSPGGSGRSTPASLLQLPSPASAAPSSPGSPLVAVWTPPSHQPSAKLVHSQYNSPMGMYSAGNVANMVQRQTGQKVKWETKPRVRFAEDPSESPTAAYVHQQEHRRQGPHEYQPPQSATIQRMAHYLGQY